MRLTHSQPWPGSVPAGWREDRRRDGRHPPRHGGSGTARSGPRTGCQPDARPAQGAAGGAGGTASGGSININGNETNIFKKILIFLKYIKAILIIFLKNIILCLH